MPGGVDSGAVAGDSDDSADDGTEAAGGGEVPGAASRASVGASPVCCTAGVAGAGTGAVAGAVAAMARGSDVCVWRTDIQ